MVCGSCRSHSLYSSVYSGDGVSSLITEPSDRSGLGSDAVAARPVARLR